MKIKNLDGQALLDFCRMISNGSIVESFQDEFDMSPAAIRDTTVAIHKEAALIGGINNLITRLESDMQLFEQKPVQNLQPSAPVDPCPVVSPPSVVHVDKVPDAIDAHDKTQEGLRDRLFDTMDALRSGKIDGRDAAVVASLAKEICNSQRTEIDIVRMRAENAKLIEQVSDRHD